MARPRSCAHCCIKIENMNVEFGGNSVVRDVNFHINCAELVALTGPNGAGKTSLLRAIIGEIPCRGKMTFQVAGRPQPSPRIGYVPQRVGIDPDSPMSVLDFVTASTSRRPIWLGVSRSLRKTAEAILAKVSGEHLVSRRLGELSGGELQRVLLAIAMAPAPNLLLLDEPVSNIDPHGLSLFYETVSNLRRNHDVAVVMVTHDLVGISPHADTVVLMDRSVVATGSPEEILSDAGLMRMLGLSPYAVSQSAAGPRPEGYPPHD